MKYSFFGTCANDHKHLIGCLKTILNQTVTPNEIVLVDSGEENQEEKLLDMISNKKIKLIYVFKNLPRVKALNLAIRKTNSDYLIRFDTRTRFDKDYAEKTLYLMKVHDKKFVGGVPSIIPENKNPNSVISAGIMSRAYIFFYPRHRIQGFSGISSLVYLGCFESTLLKNTMYPEEINLISEDSLLANNLRNKGIPPYISNTLKLSYVSRSSLKNIFRLFMTYGFCRANTIIGFRKLHSIKRYIFAIVFLICYFFLIPFGIFQKLLIFPILIFIYNLIAEINYKKEATNVIYPFLATLCQLSWIIGLSYGFSNCFNIKNKKTNFIS